MTHRWSRVNSTPELRSNGNRSPMKGLLFLGRLEGLHGRQRPSKSIGYVIWHGRGNPFDSDRAIQPQILIGDRAPSRCWSRKRDMLGTDQSRLCGRTAEIDTYSDLTSAGVRQRSAPFRTLAVTSSGTRANGTKALLRVYDKDVQSAESTLSELDRLYGAFFFARISCEYGNLFISCEYLLYFRMPSSTSCRNSLGALTQRM